MRDQGIDLTGTSWTHVRATKDVAIYAKDKLAPQGPWSFAPRSDVANFWERAADVLAIRPDAPLRAEDFTEDALMRAFGEVGPQSPSRGDERTAVAYPLGCPPVLRDVLPRILGIAADAVVDAPVALVLDAIVRRPEFRKPRLLATLTPWGNRLELALIDLEVANDLVKITLTESFAFDPSAPHSTWLSSFPIARSTSPARTLIYPSEVADSHARGLASRMKWLEAIPLRAGAIGFGAIRFAGLRSTPPDFYLGNRIRRIEGHASTAVPVGLLAAAGPGPGWCWRRLFPRAHGLSKAKPVALSSKDPGPKGLDPIVLADCQNPAFFDQEWIAQKDWDAAGLRWFATIPNSSRDPKLTESPTWTIQLYKTPGGGAKHRLLATASRTDDPPPRPIEG